MTSSCCVAVSSLTGRGPDAAAAAAGEDEEAGVSAVTGPDTAVSEKQRTSTDVE